MASSSNSSGSRDKRSATPRPTALWWFLGVLVVLAIGQALFMTPGGRQVPYSEFKALVRSGQVVEITVGDQSISGHLKQPRGEGRMRSGQDVEMRFHDRILCTGGLDRPPLPSFTPPLWGQTRKRRRGSGAAIMPQCF